VERSFLGTGGAALAREISGSGVAMLCKTVSSKGQNNMRHLIIQTMGLVLVSVAALWQSIPQCVSAAEMKNAVGGGCYCATESKPCPNSGAGCGSHDIAYWPAAWPWWTCNKPDNNLKMHQVTGCTTDPAICPTAEEVSCPGPC
jgi:hypothetical protein